MGGLVQSNNLIHNANCLAVETTRQNAVASAPMSAAVK